jgi:hypothetical protein
VKVEAGWVGAAVVGGAWAVEVKGEEKAGGAGMEEVEGWVVGAA